MKRETEVYLGKKLEENVDKLKLKCPIEHGVVKNWEDMELLWNNVYESLAVNKSEHPVLLTEAVLNPYSNREKMAEVFFEKFQVPGLFICSQALLPLYSFGKTTGVVLECGDGLTQCAPIYDGYILNNTSQRMNIGGKAVTEYLNLLLRHSGYIFRTSVCEALL